MGRVAGAASEALGPGPAHSTGHVGPPPTCSSALALTRPPLSQPFHLFLFSPTTCPLFLDKPGGRRPLPGKQQRVEGYVPRGCPGCRRSLGEIGTCFISRFGQVREPPATRDCLIRALPFLPDSLEDKSGMAGLPRMWRRKASFLSGASPGKQNLRQGLVCRLQPAPQWLASLEEWRHIEGSASIAAAGGGTLTSGSD